MIIIKSREKDIVSYEVDMLNVSHHCAEEMECGNIRTRTVGNSLKNICLVNSCHWMIGWRMFLHAGDLVPFIDLDCWIIAMKSTTPAKFHENGHGSFRETLQTERQNPTSLTEVIIFLHHVKVYFLFLIFYILFDISVSPLLLLYLCFYSLFCSRC